MDNGHSVYHSQTSDLPQLRGNDALQWCYRGEGAANIVLSYQGSDLHLVGKVLRLKKIIVHEKHVKKKKAASGPGKPILTEEEQNLWADWPSVAEATSVEFLIQAYARDVMSPLLGSELVDPGVVIPVCKDFLEKVADRVHHARPWWRINTSQIDIHGSCGLLISDHSLFWPLAAVENEGSIFPSISIEIKPKCGFLPSSTLITAENRIKMKVPRFTMHQFLKLSEGQVNAISNYSPLDLFSGNLERIYRAVDCLFENPQNNLRLFVEGSLVDMTNAEALKWQVLREALGRCFCSEDRVDPIDALKEVIAQSLYETDALKNLLAAQKLDAYDIEGAIHAYHKLQDNSAVECPNVSESHGFKSLAESRQIVRDYLIAATAKDCSLMLTFQQVSDVDVVRESVDVECRKFVRSSKTSKLFRLKINFVDLDLKPLSKMPQYLQIDQEIVKAYLTATNGGTKCSSVGEGTP